MSKPGKIRAVELRPGQQLPGLVFGSPADTRYRVKGVERPSTPGDAHMVRVTAAAVTDDTEVSVIMRAHRRIQVLI